MAQAVEERIWRLEGPNKRAAIRRMFSDLAPRYDLANSVLSFSLHHRWRALAVAMLKLAPGDRALDVCCGTGDFLKPLRHAIGPTGIALGLDFSAPMLSRAFAKIDDAAFALGDACRLPVAGGTVDGVTIGWGIRNLADIDAGHEEIARVLRPGGRFVSLDMARPRNRFVRAVSNAMIPMLLPLVGRAFGSANAYRYLAESTSRFWSREQLAASMTQAGLVDVRWRDVAFGNICIHFGRRPTQGEIA